MFRGIIVEAVSSRKHLYLENTQLKKLKNGDIFLVPPKIRELSYLSN